MPKQRNGWYPFRHRCKVHWELDTSTRAHFVVIEFYGTLCVCVCVRCPFMGYDDCPKRVESATSCSCCNAKFNGHSVYHVGDHRTALHSNLCCAQYSAAASNESCEYIRSVYLIHPISYIFESLWYHNQPTSCAVRGATDASYFNKICASTHKQKLQLESKRYLRTTAELIW